MFGIKKKTITRMCSDSFIKYNRNMLEDKQTAEHMKEQQQPDIVLHGQQGDMC